MKVSFAVTATEARLISKIAGRASALAGKYGVDYSHLDAEMDVTACHANGCPLALQRLFAADDFNFSHDVFGIRAKINRTTGKLTDCFFPRYAAPGEVRVAA